MANLIIVSGPQAVGKMTVAEKLRDKTNFRLMTKYIHILRYFALSTEVMRQFVW